MASLNCLSLKRICFAFDDNSVCSSKKKAQLCSLSSGFICWAEKESREFELETEKAREALKQLDQELQASSQKKVRAPKVKESLRVNNGTKDWNSVIKTYARSKNDKAIISAYIHMESLDILPDKATLPLVFKACVRLSEVERGRKIHYRIWDTDLVRDVRVGTALVDFYGKCGLVDEARRVFDSILVGDVVLWNAMIYGYVGCNCFEKAISLFRQMQREGFKANSRTVVGLLLASEAVYELRLGQEIHGYCLRNNMFDLDPHVGTALIGFYSFDVNVSRTVFHSMPVRNIVSWNAIITGCIGMGENLEACHLFLTLLQDGVEFDSVTIVAVIQACTELGYLNLGMQIHQMAVKSGFRNDLFVVNTLLNMYSECGDLDLALRLFENVTNRDLALWNSMIDAYIKCGLADEAVSLFTSLRAEGIREDQRTIAIMLPLCPKLDGGLRKGETLHAHVIKSGMELDVALGNAFLGLYTELNCVDAAQKVFNKMTGLDVVSWNMIIMALSSNRFKDEAWSLFEAMQALEIKPNSHTMISILAACDDKTCLSNGKAIHGFVIKHGIELDLSLNTSLAQMYLNCDDEATAVNLFERFPDRDVISWNALITSYVKNNQGEKAQLLFQQMISEVEPNSVTILNMLSLCSNLSALLEGQSFHAYITRRQFPFGNNFALGNAFVTMYARCGSMQNAERVFKLLSTRNIISWNALITGYATHGHGDNAILSLSQMLEDGVQPNAATFVAILSACRHSGFIEKGLQLFNMMVHNFKIKPELVHYGCVVDLLCRGGRLNEAREFIESLPIEPDASLWRALLSACRDRSDAGIATTVFEKLVKLDPENPGNYILLSNIYASLGLWHEVRKIRMMLRVKGLRKSPGVSWILIRSHLHFFAANDTSHTQSETIYEILHSLMATIRESGYVPDLRLVSHEEED